MNDRNYYYELADTLSSEAAWSDNSARNLRKIFYKLGTVADWPSWKILDFYYCFSQRFAEVEEDRLLETLRVVARKLPENNWKTCKMPEGSSELIDLVLGVGTKVDWRQRRRWRTPATHKYQSHRLRSKEGELGTDPSNR